MEDIDPRPSTPASLETQFLRSIVRATTTLPPTPGSSPNNLAAAVCVLVIQAPDVEVAEELAKIVDGLSDFCNCAVFGHYCVPTTFARTVIHARQRSFLSFIRVIRQQQQRRDCYLDALHRLPACKRTPAEDMTACAARLVSDLEEISLHLHHLPATLPSNIDLEYIKSALQEFSRRAMSATTLNGCCFSREVEYLFEFLHVFHAYRSRALTSDLHLLLESALRLNRLLSDFPRHSCRPSQHDLHLPLFLSELQRLRAGPHFVDDPNAYLAARAADDAVSIISQIATLERKRHEDKAALTLACDRKSLLRAIVRQQLGNEVAVDHILNRADIAEVLG